LFLAFQLTYGLPLRRSAGKPNSDKLRRTVEEYASLSYWMVRFVGAANEPDYGRLSGPRFCPRELDPSFESLILATEKRTHGDRSTGLRIPSSKRIEIVFPVYVIRRIYGVIALAQSKE